MICGEEKTFYIGPNTEVTIGCGVSEDLHLAVHFTAQIIEGVSIRYSWPGEFKEPKEKSDA